MTKQQRRAVLDTALDMLGDICACSHLDSEHVFRSLEARIVRRCQPGCSCRKYRRVLFSLRPSTETLHIGEVVKFRGRK